MTSKEKYIDFYSSHPDICIFSSPWWLDAVAGENWDVVLVENKNGAIIASFPYMYKKSLFGLKAVTMPPLTQKLGPYIVYDANKISEMKKLGQEHEIYQQIIDRLPKFDTLCINFDQAYKNWLSFYWAGFSQTTRYSYRIANIKDHDFVFDGYAKYKKQKIQKAKNLRLKFDLDFNAFYDYFEDTIKERGETVSYSRALFVRLCEAVYGHNAGRIFYCEDDEGNIHAINLTVWDKSAAYYLIAMRKAEYKTSGGTEFLVDETIKYVSQFVDIFDFEGSMIHGVEESFRWYGAHQTEYYSISKDNRLLLPLLRDCKNILRAVKRKIRGGGVLEYSSFVKSVSRVAEVVYASAA